MDHYEYTELLKTLTTKMQNVTDVVRPQDIKSRLSEITELENSDGFWNDATNAGVVQKEKTQLERRLAKYSKTYNVLGDAMDIYEMAKEEGDEETIQSLFDDAIELENQVKQMEVEVLLSGEHDS
ncbi:MAG TPA: PCRF domain-containing protein, partial [Sulfuricurvum sp.]|nr:PCRF domain-containing protein [Sulfuricurvum sp.]